MRKALYYFVMLSVLFMSLDGAADSVIEGHPHSGDPTHQGDSLKHSSPEAPVDGKLNPDHCEHCCHGHSANIVALVTSKMSMSNAGDLLAGYSRLTRSLSLPPPTPPPTA